MPDHRCSELWTSSAGWLARRYLTIEQVRFGTRLNIVWELDEAASDARVPPLILQPLVENAVRHGIATCLDGGEVEIRAGRRGALVWLVVSNPRDPDGMRPGRGTGVGQDIVKRRLGAAFGDPAALAVDATENSYRVSITFPAEEMAR